MATSGPLALPRSPETGMAAASLKRLFSEKGAMGLVDNLRYIYPLQGGCVCLKIIQWVVSRNINVWVFH